ncbi:MAG: sensor histidine kinase [Bacteroidota bacterium]
MSRKQYRILIHILAVVLGFTPPFFLLLNSDFGSNSIFGVFIICLASLPLYILNIKYLIPKLLKRGKHLQYFLALMVTMIVYISVFKITIPFDLRRIQVVRLEGEPISLPGFPIPPMIPFTLMMLIGTTLEMLLAYENRGKQIEKTLTEKVRAELSFLKSQINPHFFFNTLNSIYALAAIDSYDTQRAILLLSNLMRYLLYESDVDKVSLNKEIQFINDFIGLQKLRGSEKNCKRIDFSFTGNTEEYKIEPLLLVPFVENAFKHSHSYDKQTLIEITISVELDETMIFKCSNSIGEHKEQMEENSGIGLENVKRRLALIYPKTHDLSIVKSLNTFDVTLIINNEVHSRR